MGDERATCQYWVYHLSFDLKLLEVVLKRKFNVSLFLSSLPIASLLLSSYTAPPLAITSLYWRGWILLTMLAAHNPQGFAERAAATYPTLRALIETCITK